MKKLFFLVLLQTGYLLHAQSVRTPLATPYTTIGVYSKNFTDAFSAGANQATLAQVQHAAAGVFGERKFMLKELSNYAAAVVLPSKWGGFALSARYFGSEHLNSSQIGAGYGKKLGNAVDFGIQFNYYMMRISGYGSNGIINVEAGFLLHLTPKLHAGLHVYNPAGGKFGKDRSEKLASVYTSGMGYEVSDKFFVSIEISKEEDKPVGITAGMQYNIAKQFFARMGLTAGTGNYFWGLGLQWKACRADITSSWHPQLGFTPGMMLLFNFHTSSQQTAN